MNRENAIVRPARNPSRTLLCLGDQTLGLASASLHPFACRSLGGQHAIERGVDPLDLAIGGLFAHAAPRGFSIRLTLNRVRYEAIGVHRARGFVRIC
nr:hypothetical protein [Thiocapsa sp. KS1]